MIRLVRPEQQGIFPAVNYIFCAENAIPLLEYPPSVAVTARPLPLDLACHLKEDFPS